MSKIQMCQQIPMKSLFVYISATSLNDKEYEKWCLRLKAHTKLPYEGLLVMLRSPTFIYIYTTLKKAFPFITTAFFLTWCSWS